jgi:putative Mg2+ transporter-C (MgtC) family protein
MTTALATSDFFFSAMIHLIIAVVCGGIIGLERQLHRKAVGIRSCIIVVLTVTLMVDLGLEATQAAGDPSRVMAAVITGVGFLGGGVILAQGTRIQGVTTATLIWALAAIGIAIGLGFGLAALAMTLIVTAVAVVVDWAEARFPRLRREADAGRES